MKCHIVTKKIFNVTLFHPYSRKSQGNTFNILYILYLYRAIRNMKFDKKKDKKA